MSSLARPVEAPKKTAYVACYYCKRPMRQNGIYHDECYYELFKRPNPCQSH